MRVTVLFAGSFAVVLLAVSSVPADPLDGGTMAFAYSQFPLGPYSGDFLAEGNLGDLTTFPGADEAGCAAYQVEHDGVYFLFVLGGYGNGNATADAAILWVLSDSPLVPGVYPVDEDGLTVMFGFADDGQALEIPEDPAVVDWTEYYDALVAGHRFASTSGSITITTIGSDGITGSFEGFMSCPECSMVALLSNGSYEVGLTTVSTESTSWTRIKADHHD